MRIDFYLIDAMEIENYVPIWRALRSRGVEAELVAVPGRDNTATRGWFDYENAISILETRGLPYTNVPDYGCAAAVTTQFARILALYRRLRLRLMYGVNLSDTIFTHTQEACAGFDGVLVHGPYSQAKVRRWLPEESVRIIGYPKYDAFFAHAVEKAKLRAQLGIDSRQSILYLPTWEGRSSIDRFFPVLASLTDQFQLLIKPHHCTARMESERMRMLQNSAARLVSGNHLTSKLYAAADVVVADISSGAFGEAILTDRPLIGIHPNADDRKQHVDERVYQAAPICEDPADLLHLVSLALLSNGLTEARVALREELCSFRDGHAADRAAEAILQLVADNQQRPWRTVKRDIRRHKEAILKWAGNTKLLSRIWRPRRTVRNAVRRLVQISPTAEHLVARLKSSVGSPKQMNLVSRYQSALQWLRANTLHDGGVQVFAGSGNAYPEVAGYLIPSLLICGERDLAIQYARWLISIQNPDGSWSDSAGKAAYTFDTGQVLKGLLAISPFLPEVENPICQGCDWMLKQIETTGRITTPDKSDWGLPQGKTISENIHLYALEPLREAGKRLTEPRYLEAVDRALAYYLAQPDLTRFNTLSHFHAYVLEALVDLGYPEVAAMGMAEVERLQRTGGSVPAYSDVDWVCSTGLAQYAVVWYKLGKREHAVKAFDGFCRLQNRSGGFYGSYGRGANYFPDREISWAVKFFLDAYQWHIRTAFDSQASEFPDLISPKDGRFQAIKSGLGQITGERVLDAGCGRGRVARALLKQYPKARIVGVDISAEMLKCVPGSVETRQGSLLNLPFPENSFDHAYSVEALEHAINPESAIAELCRVVKPGGRIIVIDKNQERHGALKIESWERWFKRSEVESWLSKYCADVRSERICYDRQVEPDGLFFAWQGTRRC
jgi:malonyl-CoA O-methyltransferase